MSPTGSHGLRVGIAWQGNADPRIDQRRSAPLAAFAPLADIPDVRLISLQKGPGQTQIGSVAFGHAVEELGAEFDAGPDAFLDTAAVMQSLDLVVSVDTSVAHLAGALNRPVLILLKRLGAHWAWLYGRTDSLFYKGEINRLSGSALVGEKAYAAAKSDAAANPRG